MGYIKGLIKFLFFVSFTFFTSSLSAQCYTSVNCSDGAEWQDVKRSVGKMFVKVNGIWTEHCTGSLVNGAGMFDSTPYFISAKHCFTPSLLGALDPSNFKILWGEETIGCSNVDEPYSETNVTYGAEYVLTQGSVGDAEYDFILFKLLSNPRDLPGFNPYFSGWSNNEDTEGVFASIHYPLDFKLSISIDENGVVSHNSNVCNTQGINRVLAATFGSGKHVGSGSSGAPIFDAQKRLRGVLSCAGDPCITQNLIASFSDFTRALKEECPATNQYETLKCSDLKVQRPGEIEYTSISGFDDLCPLRFNFIYDCDKFFNCQLIANVMEGQSPFTYEWRVRYKTENNETVDEIVSNNYYVNLPVIHSLNTPVWTLTIEDDNGCIAYASILHEGGVKDKDTKPRSAESSQKEERKQNHIYPNPANTNLFIDLNSYSSLGDVDKVSITNVSNKNIISKAISKVDYNGLIEVDVDQVPVGIYFVHLSKEGTLVHSEKIVIVH